MTTYVQHETFGTIVYEENAWTGKKQITIGGVGLIPNGKNAFLWTTPTGNVTVTVSGNVFTAVKLMIASETVVVSPAPKWYEFILAFLPFVLVMIWGNSKALCAIIPIVGGAIGGAISGVLAVVSLLLMKSQKSMLHKILVGVGVTVACFAVCALFGIMLVSALS